MVSKNTIQVNPKHPLVPELSKETAADLLDKTVEGIFWLLLEASLLASGSNRDEAILFAGRIRRITKFGVSFKNDVYHHSERLRHSSEAEDENSGLCRDKFEG